MAAKNRKPNLLILDGDKTHDFLKIFEDELKYLNIIQSSWVDTSIVSYEHQCIVTCKYIRTSLKTSGETVTFDVDFVLMRNQARGPTPKTDRRNVFFGLMHSNIPSVNCLESEYLNMERPIMFGALKKVKERLPEFPLIEQNYYCNFNDMIISPDFPSIVKVSHAHAGKGKIQVDNYDRWRGVSSILALHDDYCTGEPFLEAEIGFRIQKIGEHYRFMRKQLSHSTWTTHDGGSILTSDMEEGDVPEKYRRWIDECSKELCGMDICALDGLVLADGSDVILELNSTACGFLTEYWVVDTLLVKEVVIRKMKSLSII